MERTEAACAYSFPYKVLIIRPENIDTNKAMLIENQVEKSYSFCNLFKYSFLSTIFAFTIEGKTEADINIGIKYHFSDILTAEE